jgi:hypothetical protein
MAAATTVWAKEIRPPRREISEWQEERRSLMAKKYDIELLKLDLACSIRSFCLYFFPNGKYVGKEYGVGSLGGEPGKSLKICITGERPACGKTLLPGKAETTS